MLHPRYLTCDVFTDHLFGGNQLAVFPDASEIAPELMPRIAREFNYSETTFVLPASNPKHTRRVRIFTPGGELAFAGHPTIGTAHVLASTGAVELTGEETHVILEEGVGPVPVTIRASDGKPTFAQLTVAKLPEVGPTPPSPARLAAMLSLKPDDLVGSDMPAEAISCGTPFLFVPLRDRAAVARARARVDLLEQTLGNYWTQMVMVFALEGEQSGSDVRARMFAPTIGVPEDPATGSAAVGLGGYLAARDPRFDAKLRWVVEQGFEMGRPSILEVEAEKQAGRITSVRVGGQSVVVCEGRMQLGTD
jgi:trans-2,3-dihydro-3-hydroxyanthranilate isomerase